MKQFTKYLQKFQSAALAASMVFSVAVSAAPMAVSAAPAVSAPFTSTGKVSFTFDDGLQSTYTQAAPVLSAHNVPGVNYVTTDCIGLNTVPNNCAADGTHPYMTWQQVADLKNVYGWEVASHSVTHPQLSTDRISGVITAQQMIDEINKSKTAIKDNTTIDAVNFADPFGDYDTISVAAIAKQYASHRGFHDIANNVFPYNDYMLTVQQVQGNVPVATVKGYIEQAKANGQWLILVFHEITAGTASTNIEDYQYSKANLEEIVAYATSAAVNLPVTDIAHGLANSSTNMLPNGTFDNGIADGWTTDSAANVVADSTDNGSYPSAAKSIAFTAGAGNAHLFSPQVAVTAGTTYLVKNYMHVTAFGSTATVDSEIAVLVDEYDSNNLPIGSQYHSGIKYTTTANALNVKNLNFTYTPSVNAVKIRLQVVVTGNSGIHAYYDNAQMFPLSAIGSAVVTPPTPTAPGDADGDGKAGIADATKVALNWGKTGATRTDGDVTGDGNVGIEDATLIALNWSN